MSVGCRRVQPSAIELYEVSRTEGPIAAARFYRHFPAVHKQPQVPNISRNVKAGSGHLRLRDSVPAVLLYSNLQPWLSGDGPLVLNRRRC